MGKVFLSWSSGRIRLNRKREVIVSQWRLFRLFAILAVAILLPTLAQSAVKATLHLFHAVTLSGTELHPGTYSLVVTTSKAILKQFGEVVTEATVRWKDGDENEFATHVVLDGNSIKEIRFAGKTRYIVVQQW